MAFYPEVTVGQKFVPSVLLENDIRRLINVQNGFCTPALRATGGLVQISCYNATQKELAAGSGVMFDSKAGMCGESVPAVPCTDPARPWGVLQSTLPPKGMGGCIVAGPAKVKLSGTGTGDYAAPSPGNPAVFERGNAGAQILHALDGVGLLLLGGGAAAGAAFYTGSWALSVAEKVTPTGAVTRSLHVNGGGVFANEKSYIVEGKTLPLQAGFVILRCRFGAFPEMVAFDRNKFKAQNFDYIAGKVGRLIQSPALVAWYLFDEPELPKFGVHPYEIRRINQLIKALDPSRPTLITFCIEQVIPRHHGCFDVYLTQAYQPSTANVLKEYTDVDKYIEGNPATRLNIINFRALETGNPGKEEEAIFNAALISMMKGSGIMHWWWDNSKRDLSKHRGYFAKLQEVIPLFAAPGEYRQWEQYGVACYAKEINGKKILIAVNTSDEPVTLPDYGVVVEPQSNVILK